MFREPVSTELLMHLNHLDLHSPDVVATSEVSVSLTVDDVCVIEDYTAQAR